MTMRKFGLDWIKYGSYLNDYEVLDALVKIKKDASYTMVYVKEEWWRDGFEGYVIWVVVK